MLILLTLKIGREDSINEVFVALLFCGCVGWYCSLNSGLMLARQELCHLSHVPSPFALVYSLGRVSCFCLGLASYRNLPTSAMVSLFVDRIH
jgi:hypothetical protein